MRALRFGGRRVIVGWAGDTTVAKGHGRRGSENAEHLPTNIIQMKRLTVMGSPMAIHSQRDLSIRRERFDRIMQWAEEGAAAPMSCMPIPWRTFARASPRVSKGWSRAVASCIREMRDARLPGGRSQRFSP